MKFLTYVLRNARRNPVRSILTIASTSLSLFLMMILVSFFTINDEVATSTRVYNRVITLNSQGFAGMLPIVRVREIRAMDGVLAVTPFSWFGGKYNNQTMPFAQFGVDPATFFTIYSEFETPEEQIQGFLGDPAGCAIGRKLAEDYNLAVGDPLPLQADLYPIDLNLTVRAIYSGPRNSDQRMCLFNWEYFDELMKKSTQGKGSGNAGAIVTRVKTSDLMTPISKKIDDAFLNTDNPTRTQTEEAFSKFFVEMLGDLKGMVRWIGLAVLASLVLVGANALAMALRERTTEVAVLKAIGFNRQLILFLVLAEAMIVAGIGGLLGTFGCKLLFDTVDLSKFTAGLLPFFYIPWMTAILGLVVSLLLGFVSGFVPALRAARLSVIDGLRKVV